MVGGGLSCYLFWAREYKTCEWISLYAKVTAKCLFQTISSHEATLTLFSLSKNLWEVGYRLNLSHYTDKKWNHWTLKWFMKHKLKVRKKKKIWFLVFCQHSLSELPHAPGPNIHFLWSLVCILEKLYSAKGGMWKRQKDPFLLSPWPLVFSFPSIMCMCKLLYGRNVNARTLKRLINTEPQSKSYHYVSKLWNACGDFYIFTEML